MDIFLNGIQAVQNDGRLILGILLCVAWGALIVFALLKRFGDGRTGDADLAALALGGWPAPMLLLSCLYLPVYHLISPGVAYASAALLMAASAGIALFSLLGKVRRETGLPVLGFLFLVFVRLGFTAGAILPPYFDSAEHYRIIQSLLNNEGFTWPTASYYHLGYHAIAALLASLSHAGLARVMLVFGQIVLAALPMPMYFLVRSGTGSRSAALLAASAAAFGWSMPAGAVNWGKYPALLGLVALQFAVGVSVLRKFRLSTGAALAAMLIHTRMIILMGILAAGRLLSRVRRSLLIGVTSLILAVEILVLWRDPRLRAVLEPYMDWATLLVLLLAVLAWQPYPRLVSASILVLAAILGGMLIPLPPTLTLLDRPFVEMALYLPLAFLCGLGASRMPGSVNVALAMVIAIHAWTSFSFSPSACCQLAGPDDAAALGWIGKELPKDARVGIAVADLSLSLTGAPLQNTGADAGIWVRPLTGRNTRTLPYFIDFTRPETHELLCAEKVTHLYIGGNELSFRMRSWVEYPGWYEVLFALPKAQVIEVLGCK